jgi:hypothetical protein
MLAPMWRCSVAVVVVVVGLGLGCSKDPVKADAALFCAVDPTQPVTEWGPRLEREAKSPDLAKILTVMKTTGSSAEAEAALRAGVDPCPALAMFKPRPKAP